MKYKSFGKTGIKVSELILGTWYLPNHVTDQKRVVDKESAIKLIRRAYDLGINFFDTADVYRGVYDRDTAGKNFDTVGMSETVLGEALKGYDRESYVVATKVMGRTGPLTNDSSANRKHVVKAIRKSLERLRMDYVDFYIIHAPDESTGFEQSARTMNILEDEGLILHYGISNFSSHDLVKFLDVKNSEPPDFIQDKYNLIERNLEDTNIKIAEDNSLASMIYSPLAQGVLAGRYLKGDNGNSRLEYEKWFSRRDVQGYKNEGYNLHENHKIALERLKEVASSEGASMSQLALSWLIHRGKFIFPILGATKLEQLEENVNGADITLNQNELDDLGKLFAATQ